MTSMDKRRGTVPGGGSRKQNVYVVCEVDKYIFPVVHGVYSNTEKAEAMVAELNRTRRVSTAHFTYSKHRIQ